MARTNNLTNFLTDVATAIKQKTGDNTAIPAANFDTEIASIQTGGNYQDKEITFAQNGNYTLRPDTGYDAMTEVAIEVAVAGIDTSDATATANDIINPKTAYVNGQKITGGILVSKLPLDTGVDKYQISTYGQSGCVTRDGRAVIIWYNSTIYTAVMNEALGNYEIKNTYTESQLGITNFGNYDYASRLIDCSAYEPNTHICYVAFHRYKNNMQVVTFNADTGALLYTGDNNEYIGTRSWYGIPNGDRQFPMVYLEPVYCIAFSETNPNILYMSYDNGFSRRYTSWTSVTKQSWAHGGNFDTSSHSFIGTTGSDGYFIKDNVLSVLSADGQSISGTINLGTNPTLNIGNTWVVADGKLYSITDTGSGITKGGEITLSVTLANKKGHWLNETTFCQIDNNNVYVYELSDLANIKTTVIETMNFLNIIRNDIAISTSTSVSCNVLKPVSGSLYKLVSTYLPEYRTTTYNIEDATGKATDVLSGKTVYISTGAVSGTMPNNGALTYTPSTSQQLIPAGYTSGGTIAAISSETEPNLATPNIIYGKSIFGVNGAAINNTVSITKNVIVLDGATGIDIKLKDATGTELSQENNLYSTTMRPTTIEVYQLGSKVAEATQDITTDGELEIQVGNYLNSAYDDYTNENLALVNGGISTSIGSQSGSLTFPEKDDTHVLYTSSSGGVNYSVSSSMGAYILEFDFYKANSNSYSRVVGLTGAGYEIEVKGASNNIYWGGDISAGWRQNQWNTLKLVKASANSGSVSLYMNGNLVATKNYTGSLTGIWFGRGLNNGDYFTGYYRNVKLYVPLATPTSPLEVTFTETSISQQDYQEALNQIADLFGGEVSL